MFGVNDTKTQDKTIPAAADAPRDAIISPDALRANRLPPGQSRTLKWPVLDAFGPPRIDAAEWQLSIFGLVGRSLALNWQQFNELPRVKVFADFHCVTRWSRLGNVWEGVRVRELLGRAEGAKPEARYVIAHGYDSGWTTNLPLDELLAEDALVATHHDGEPLHIEHGAPARLIVPRLYAWKSAKWLCKLELTSDNTAGFWERNGYHMTGDPWKEERFRHGR